MGHALRFTTTARMGPIVAALGAVAAGTLVAATILGQSLGPIPVDNPALALRPGAGAGQPLIIGVPSEEAAIATLLPAALVADLPLPVPLAPADDLLPNSTATGQPITSVSEESRTEPVPPEASVIDNVQRRISELVRVMHDGSGPASVVDEVLAPKKEHGVRSSAERKAAGTSVRVAVEVPQPVEITPVVELVAVVKEDTADQTLEIVEGSDELQEPPAGLPQPEPTAAGSASPAL